MASDHDGDPDADLGGGVDSDADSDSDSDSDSDPDSGASSDPDPDPEVLLRLPGSMRDDLKEPFGPVYTDAGAVLADAGEPVVAVGDVVTYHLLEAGHRPRVAFVDGKTEREAVDRRVADAIDGFDERIEVENPAATLTVGLLSALRAGLDHPGSTLVRVTGEEDLAALPALVAAPEGGSVVYGQPGEGMVLAAVTPDLAAEARGLLVRMPGDVAAAWAALGVDDEK